MRPDEAARTPVGGRGLDGESAGPVVARLVLGARLCGLREERGISRVAAGHVIRASRSKISRLEGGRHGVKPRDVEDLLTLYGVTDEAERATLLTLAVPNSTEAEVTRLASTIPVQQIAKMVQ